MTSLAEAEPPSWDDLHRHVQSLFGHSSRVQLRLAQRYLRPMKAPRHLRELSSQRDELRTEVESIVEGLGKIVLITPDKTMAETLSSCLDTLRLSAELTRLQLHWSEVDSSLQQTGAFAFAVVALYVSLLSLFATVTLGVLALR